MEYKNKSKVPLLPKKPLKTTLSNGASTTGNPVLSRLEHQCNNKDTLSQNSGSHQTQLCEPFDKPKPPPRPSDPVRPPAPLRPPPYLPAPVMRQKFQDKDKEVARTKITNRVTFNPEQFRSYEKENKALVDKNANVSISNKPNKLLARPLPPLPMTSNLNKMKSMSAPNLFISDDVFLQRPHANTMLVDETIYEDDDQCDGSPGKHRVKQFAARTRANLNPNKLKNAAKFGLKKGLRKWNSFGESDLSGSNSIMNVQEIIPEAEEIKEVSKNNRNRYSELHTDSDAQLFECVIVVTLKDNSGNLIPEITFQFPPTFNKENVDQTLLSIPQFCFPDTSLSYKHGETFSFVLTSDSGKRRFGFCRMIKSASMTQPEVYCIISPYGLFGLYSQILEEVENQRRYSSTAVFSLLKTTLSKPLPQPTESIDVSFFSSGSSSSMRRITLTRPGDSAIHEHVKLKLLFDTVKAKVILELLTCLLTESKVILSSKSLSLLTSCCHALISLMYPFEWEHTYIPVLPTSLIDIVCLPSPYLLGVLPSSVPEIEDLPIEEVYILNLDTGEQILHPSTKCGIPKYLCDEISSSLKQVFDLSSDEIDVVDGAEKAQNEIICKIFVQVYIQLIGHFERFYTKDEDGRDIIDYKPFYKASETRDKKHFLRAFALTQAFQKFTTSRKCEGPTHDLFESSFSAWKISKDDGTGHFKTNIDSMLTIFTRKFRK